jgi:uncharacterized membrane protein
MHISVFRLLLILLIVLIFYLSQFTFHTNKKQRNLEAHKQFAISDKSIAFKGL